MGRHQLISSSRVSFDLLLFVSLLVVKSGKKGENYHLNILGHYIHLTKNRFVRIFHQSYRVGGEAISTGFLQGSSKCVNIIVQPKGY